MWRIAACGSLLVGCAHHAEEAKRTTPSPTTCFESKVGAPWPSGARVPLAPGGVTLVWFWATWEEPSKKAFPKLQELYAKYKDRGFEIVGVSVDDDSTNIADAVHDWGAKFAIAWDRGHKIADCVQLSTEPSSYLVDRQGVVRGYFGGYRDGEIEQIERALVPLLTP